MFENESDGHCTASPTESGYYLKEVERIKFEEWATANGATLERCLSMGNAFGIEYRSNDVQAAWSGWLARAGLMP